MIAEWRLRVFNAGKPSPNPAMEKKIAPTKSQSMVPDLTPNENKSRRRAATPHTNEATPPMTLWKRSGLTVSMSPGGGGS